MKVITTVHKAGFEQYGHRWVDSIANWPQAEFLMYAEGFEPSNVSFKRTEDVARLEAFKHAHKDYKPVGWQWDVVRFANKVFAAYDAFYSYDGLGVYMDADCVTYQKLPKGYIEGLLPKGKYLGLFKRAGLYTETGFWVVDCSHPKHQEFLDSWLEWYESGEYRNLDQWHDCMTMDATVRVFEKMGMFETVSLSQGFERDGHPMAKADLGKYIDHTKGPRKALGRSPENAHRK